MKCKCGRVASIELLKGDHMTIAAGYNRIRCDCGIATPWCDVYFQDGHDWLRRQWEKIQSKLA